MIRHTRLHLNLLLATAWCVATGANAQAPAPTYADVAYGEHPRNRLDFWKATSTRPAPVIVFIHGGGFRAGDKAKVRETPIVGQSLSAGISFAAINYRFLEHAPIQDILRDAARAIQFLRRRAPEWNIDKKRVAAFGGSAGAGASLWLAFHDDLADPSNPDPVLRESSRLAAAAATATQFSYDILQWEQVLGLPAERFQDFNPAMYGLSKREDLDSLAGRKIRADVDMRGLITPDDPPVFLVSPQKGGVPASKGEINHHPNHAVAIKERCDKLGVKAVLWIPGVDGKRPPPDGLFQFLRDHLKSP